jgi:hypothetical protein
LRMIIKGRLLASLSFFAQLKVFTSAISDSLVHAICRMRFN